MVQKKPMSDQTKASSVLQDFLVPPLINNSNLINCQDPKVIYYNPTPAASPGRAEDGAAEGSIEIIGDAIENGLDCGMTGSEAWELRSVKNNLVDAEQIWYSKLKNWKVFTTLTFRDLRSPDVAEKYFTRLIQVLNKNAFGKNYRKKVKHSYFSYIRGIEFQRRNVVHFHFLADAPINFDLVHRWWGNAAGFAWIDKVEDQKKALKYVCKYITKGGRVDRWMRNKVAWPPEEKPLWWREDL